MTYPQVNERPNTSMPLLQGESIAPMIDIPRLGAVLAITRGATMQYELPTPGSPNFADDEGKQLDRPPLMLILAEPAAAKRITGTLSRHDEFSLREGSFSRARSDSVVSLVSFQPVISDDPETQRLGLMRFLTNPEDRHAHKALARLKDIDGFRDVLAEAFRNTTTSSVKSVLTRHDKMYGSGDKPKPEIVARAKSIGDAACQIIFNKKPKPVSASLTPTNKNLASPDDTSGNWSRGYPRR